VVSALVCVVVSGLRRLMTCENGLQIIDSAKLTAYAS